MKPCGLDRSQNPNMKLPNAHLALIPTEKLRAYLLDPTHPDNGGKAAFFFHFGFTADDPDRLAHALRNLAQNTEVTQTSAGYAAAVRYIIDGPLETPTGRTPLVRSIWVMEPGQTLPRLITAYPAK